MRWYHSLLACALGVVAAAPAPAGIFFNRKPKANPAQRVPELVQIVTGEKDERKRANAAEELLQFDGAAHPAIAPVLINALQSDPKLGVRLEAAHSLGKLRPASQEARQALEKAASSDSSLRVRLQSRTALLFYPSIQNNPAPGNPPQGNTAQRPSAAPQQQTGEPPLAGQQQPGTQPGPQLNPPPVIVNPNSAPPVSSGGYRPLPVGPSQGASQVRPVQSQEPPLTVPVNDGPVLIPPPR
jgi:hypothetical protein